MTNEEQLLFLQTLLKLAYEQQQPIVDPLLRGQWDVRIKRYKERIAKLEQALAGESIRPGGNENAPAR